MQRWINIATKLLELIGLLFGKKPKVADVGEKNLDAISVGLNMAPQTEEVMEAKSKIVEIAALREEERDARAGEVKAAQEIVEKAVKAKPILTSNSRKINLIKKIKEAEAAKKAQEDPKK